MVNLQPPEMDNRPLAEILKERKAKSRAGPFPRWQKGMKTLKGGGLITPAIRGRLPNVEAANILDLIFENVKAINVWSREIKTLVVMEGADIPRVSEDAPGNHANMRVSQWVEYFAKINPGASNTVLMSLATACFREWGKLHYHKRTMKAYARRGVPTFPPLDVIVVPINSVYVQGKHVWFPDFNGWIELDYTPPVELDKVESYEIALEDGGDMWVRFKIGK